MAVPFYEGLRLYCDGCEKFFRSGDQMLVWHGHTFCYPISGTESGIGSCHRIWRKKHKEGLLKLGTVIDEEEFDYMIYAREEKSGDSEQGTDPAYI